MEGDLTPESDKGGHLIELSEDEAEVLRSDPDVPRERQKDESGGQLLTVYTRTRAGSTRARPEET